MKKIFLLCTLVFCSVINAQSTKSPWAVDLNLNFREYTGDLGYQLFSFKDGNAQPGIGVSRYINPWFNARAFANYGASDFTATNPMPMGVNNRLLINSTNVGLQGIFKLNNDMILKEEALLAPFIGLGVSFWSSKSSAPGGTRKGAFALPVTTGLNFQVHPRVSIMASLAYNFLLNDKIDGFIQNVNDNKNDALLQYSVGVGFNFGNNSTSKKTSDSDFDGVADVKDRCPNTRRGAKVDEFGCEILSLEANSKIKGIVNNILFEVNSDQLKESSKLELDKVVVLLNKYSDGIMIIEGHTDNTGNADYNLSLSSRRAERVKSYLVSKGISVDRLVAKGYGHTLPEASNDTEEGRKLNRRVELILTK
jgi:outer membrane protein OmpA-like peptidoglycan-associated protein